MDGHSCKKYVDTYQHGVYAGIEKWTDEFEIAETQKLDEKATKSIVWIDLNNHIYFLDPILDSTISLYSIISKTK